MAGIKTQTDPKVDYAFKHVFGREESKPALKSLVGAVFQSAGEPGIASLELLNPFNAKDAENDKLSVVDIKARDENGRQFFVEMQMLASADFLQRVLYYWACLYRDQLHESENYPILRPTMAVYFVDTPLFPDLDELTTDLDRWLYFLRHGAELNAKAPPAALNTAEVFWAIGDLLMISRIDPERELYEARLKARRDEAARQKYAREEGLREGRAELLRQLIQPL
ncbi:MAG TPA: Rpn family recombination-promoting nuclease/putative transposase [Pirellulales bacterium]